MATRQVVSAASGQDVPVPARSLCIHGDTAGAVGLARAVRAALAAAGVTVQPFA
jgi:5-oxoprolinase (ATP-hydrolysing) subunit A